MFEDKTLVCKDCGKEFVWTAGEQEFYASREPYGEWIDRNLVELARLKIPNVKVESYTGDQLTRLQKVFGYKYEDVNTMILSMARAGA